MNPDSDDPGIPNETPISEQGREDYIDFELGIPKRCRVEKIKANLNWKPSLGEKRSHDHFRYYHYHAVCDPKTGWCEIHYDIDDPHESPISLLKHMYGSKVGRGVLVVLGIAIAVVAGYAVSKKIR